MGDAKSTRRNVAVFLDMENLVGGYASETTGLRLGALVAGIEDIVRESGVGSNTAVVRAYANWGSPGMARFQREILKFGVEPVQIFSFDKNVKNAADIELCVDVLSVAHESPWIDVFVIATGDGGFIPLVRRLHALNKYVVVVSTNVPEAGVVNALLKSVADEYHQIPMSKVHMPDSEQPPKAPSLSAAATVKTAPKVPKVSAAAAKKKPTKQLKFTVAPTDQVPDRSKFPAITEFRRAIYKIIEQSPGLVVDNKANASALGSRLRSEYPQLGYKACGSKTLTEFLATYCALGIMKTGPAQVPTAATDISEPNPEGALAAPNGISTRAQKVVVDAVRREFTSGPLGHEVKVCGTGGLHLSRVGIQLRTAIEGFTPISAGFPLLHQVLDHALTRTDYRVRFEAGSVAVVHDSFA
ncbi:NYN domain-containing protein [Paeniglutamicibacter sp. ABSL32-1]|uniref:NYN domain-containing protein n=1 Tax=Paeniglutamicibacter quisquiliarum TaxID=2849498 RepID=UPI001C2DE7B3|nr:NYN domain-containing protein [Paeniglutamicibacter quisquiliarum]MBV1779109.1 NYN domain-containing protein [Paeniglutamicibacter quisquiliarum]